jgi:hypothetical protein
VNIALTVPTIGCTLSGNFCIRVMEGLPAKSEEFTGAALFMSNTGITRYRWLAFARKWQLQHRRQE